MPGPPNGNNGTTWGSSTTNVWSGLAHWDGAQWTFPQAPGIDGSVTRVVAAGPTDAFFIGNTVWHYDGASFTALSDAPGGTLTGFDPVSRDLWFYESGDADTLRYHPPH